MCNRYANALLVIGCLLLLGCQSTPSRTSDEAAQALPGAPLPDVDRKSVELFDEALAAIHAERYTEAEKLLKELTSRDPDLSGPWFNLGSVYAALGDEKAIAANPNNCAAYTELGVLSRRSGDFLSAEANYLACVSRVPDFREAYLNLGILYELYLGRLDDALKAYQTYQSLSESPDRRVAGWVSDLERRLAGNES
jgi:tetratricopeptide (TPR) repeat protein